LKRWRGRIAAPSACQQHDLRRQAQRQPPCRHDPQSSPTLTRSVSKSKQKIVHGRNFSENRYLV
jgi:hypothetical protein